MYLKKIEIAGFKSFANKTVIDFMPSDSIDEVKGNIGNGEKKKMGITAIVGPNGSGKSNIADAIRWVMGEQSMKNLRGKKSEDVIFAGSGNKGKLNYASVSLHLDNSDKKIPLDFAEVIIRRKIYRSGESEYLINGSKVRLVDVTDLLAKAGVGKDSYSVVNQGMSDAVLNASVSERKSILEDAAGVKQYQIKKERALKKLEATSKNLLQVSALLGEIEPHLKILKRQADKAQKGAEIRNKLRELQEKYFAFLWHSFQVEKEESFKQKEDLGREVILIQREMDKLNDFVESESQKLRQNKRQDELKFERDKVYRVVNVAEREIMMTEGKMEILRDKIRQQGIIKEILVDKGYIQEELEKIHEAQRELSERIGKIKTLEELKELKDFILKIEKNIVVLRGDIDKGKVEGKKTQEQIEAEKEGNKELMEMNKSLEKLRKEIQDARGKIAQINAQIQAEVEKDAKAREEFFVAEEKLRESQRRLDISKDKFNDAKVSLARIEVREEDLTAEAKNNLNVEISKLVFDGEKIDRYDMEQKISRLKIQMEQIGGIDPLIVEEYEETNKRYETLQQESKDLEQAITSLLEIAKEMDKKIDVVFAEAFGKINDEFSKYFKIIFGGGKASLVKTKKKKITRVKKAENDGLDVETEDKLEAEIEELEDDNKDEIGVDILACPPGKKISNLSMLSGGERSLTSLALLFAIISYNPPPFSMLDEVEAALDEANSMRFSKILKTLSNQTQFVAITHNRETMRQASYIYGATMGDDGVSKLLSIKLEQDDSDNN
ncbi:MAG: AAA family ATPase [Candidatus Moranbacteria bacterium]|jgi:chromosome segregation protein|nr:AAA family ATPase [Candidatus Moranbacteria bacterium]